MIRIDGLTLRVPTMSEQQAAGLARDVAQALRAWPAPQSPVRVEHVTATVAVRPSTDGGEPLARQIADAVIRAALREGGA